MDISPDFLFFLSIAVSFIIVYTKHPNKFAIFGAVSSFLVASIYTNFYIFTFIFLIWTYCTAYIIVSTFFFPLLQIANMFILINEIKERVKSLYEGKKNMDR